MAYEQFPIVEVDLDYLLLDLDNYRIPTHRDDEAGALKYLFMSEDVLGMAKLILRTGYFDNEVPVVAPAESDSQRYTVLEGNRRVSALKLLHDPTIVPGHESELRSILKKYALEAERLPRRIRVLVAPDRAAVAHRIARLHTGDSKRRWSFDQQATFYYSLIDDLTTVDDVRAQYPDIKITRMMRAAVMRRFLSAVPFRDLTLRQYAASDALKMFSFEYAYRNKDIADIIGVEFDQDGMLLPRSMTPEKIGSRINGDRLQALECLVSEFRANRLNTRSPELRVSGGSDGPHQSLLSRLRGGLISPASYTPPELPPDDDKQGSVSGNSTTNGVGVGGGEASGGSEHGSDSGRGPNHPDTKDHLPLDGLDYSHTAIGLKVRYEELRRISLSQLPVAAAILMRLVLEATIKAHFIHEISAKENDLSQVFQYVTRAYGQDKLLKPIVNHMKDGGSLSRPGSLVWFNLVAHNPDLSVAKTQLHEAWRAVEPLLRRLLLPVKTSHSS